MADPDTQVGGDGETQPAAPAPKVEAVQPLAPEIADVQEGVHTVAVAMGTPEIVPEYPVITRYVASFSVPSAEALKAELGLSGRDLLVGIPTSKAASLGLAHGEVIRVTADGKTVVMGERNIRVVTRTPKGSLTNIGISKGIRDPLGLKDHEDKVPFTVVMIDGQKTIWIKTAEKNTTDLTP